MKRTLLCIGISIFLVFQNFAQTETPDQLIEDIVNEEYVVGVAAGYSVKGEIIWESAKGYSDQESKTLFKLDTKVRIASIAKSMTAIAVMQLVEQGKIDINEPIDTYIPEFIQNGKTKITTKHILSQTSGIGAYKNKKEAKNTKNYTSLLEAYNVFKDRNLLFEPGTQYAYTTYGYVVLGILIEKTSGQSYESYMQEHIWDKANMIQTGIEKFNITRENSSLLYQCEKQGKLRQSKANDLSNRIPGGGFYSTLGDLLKFGNALLDNIFVSEETLKLMTQHHSLEKVNNSYGFGFYLYGKQPNVRSIFGHNGAQTGCSSQLFIVPNLNTVTVVISNTSNAGREVSTLAGQLIGESKKED